MDLQRIRTAMVLWTASALVPLTVLAEGGYSSLGGGTAGGAGGEVVHAATGTEIHEALCSRPASDSPLIIYVQGTITHANTSGVSGDSCNSGDGDDRIEIKDVSNVSIIGEGDGALFDQIGIHVRSSSNIVLQNLHVRNVKKSGTPTSNGGDAIGMESDVHHVWVDHCTLEASGGESEGYDALFDLKATTQYVTLSYSILQNSGRGGLVGSSDSDDDNGPVTYHHNLFENLDSRVPLLRHGTAHAYNNHYDGIHKSGMNPRIGGQIKAENNYIENAKDPLGTFYTNDMGYWDVSGNVFAATVTWSDDGDDNHPAGPNPSSTTSIAIPYSYTLDDADCVPQLVEATAGVNRGLQRSDGSCGTVQDPGTSGDGGVDGGSATDAATQPSMDAATAADGSASPADSGTSVADGAVESGDDGPGSTPTAPGDPSPSSEAGADGASWETPGAFAEPGGSGCAVGAGRPSASSGLAALALLAIPLLARRRRRTAVGAGTAL